MSMRHDSCRRHRRSVGPAAMGALAVTAMLAATPAAGQQEPCDAAEGTLGIQEMRCEGCSFGMSESGLDRARFRTEPEIMAVARGAAAGDRLRPGDRIVAVDGALVTTAEGSRRLTALRAGQRLTLRVRRDSEPVDLRLVAGGACDLRRRLEREEVEIDAMRESELERLPAPRAPAAPSAPGQSPRAAAPPTAPLPAGQPRLPAPGGAAPLPLAPGTPTPPAGPAAPAPPPTAPDGYLGFGFTCTSCGSRNGVYFFSTPPAVRSVVAGGPAARAGLQWGDEILAVDGRAIDTAEGARRFGAVAPGDTVRYRVRRNAAVRELRLIAIERAPAPATAGADGALRFEGRLRDTRIEIRGAPVHVTRDEASGTVVIRTSDAVIVLTSDG